MVREGTGEGLEMSYNLRSCVNARGRASALQSQPPQGWPAQSAATCLQDASFMVHELVWAQLPHEVSLHGRAGPGITLFPSLTLPAGKGRAAC